MKTSLYFIFLFLSFNVFCQKDIDAKRTNKNIKISKKKDDKKNLKNDKENGNEPKEKNTEKNITSSTQNHKSKNHQQNSNNTFSSLIVLSSAKFATGDVVVTVATPVTMLS